MADSQTTATARDGVFIDETVHEIYKQLTEGSDPVNVPFRTMKDAFLWAASLGFKRGTKRPIAGKRILVFRWAQFTPQTDVPLLKALALADSEDLAILLNQNGMLSIAEEYANAGIHELRALVLGQNGQPLWNLISICQDQNRPK
jgi:dnd system-associated protein 4